MSTSFTITSPSHSARRWIIKSINSRSHQHFTTSRIRPLIFHRPSICASATAASFHVFPRQQQPSQRDIYEQNIRSRGFDTSFWSFKMSSSDDDAPLVRKSNGGEFCYVGRQARRTRSWLSLPHLSILPDAFLPEQARVPLELNLTNQSINHCSLTSLHFIPPSTFYTPRVTSQYGLFTYNVFSYSQVNHYHLALCRQSHGQAVQV